MLNGLDSFRIRLLFEGNKIFALQGLYDSGQTDKKCKRDRVIYICLIFKYWENGITMLRLHFFEPEKF